MTTFPLYETLSQNIQDKDLTKNQKQTFIHKVEHIDKKGAELIYALIQYHHIKYEQKQSHITPYKAIYEKYQQTITIDLQHLPNILKQIIFKFILLHSKHTSVKSKIPNDKDSIYFIYNTPDTNNI